MDKMRLLNYDEYKILGVLSLTTSKMLSSYYFKYSKMSYHMIEIIREEIPEEYKQYKDWYPYEIRSEFGDDICNELLEDVWILESLGCINGEYNNCYSAPTFQEVIEWLVNEKHLYITCKYNFLEKKWSYIIHNLDTNYIFESLSVYNNYYESLDKGIQMVLRLEFKIGE